MAFVRLSDLGKGDRGLVKGIAPEGHDGPGEIGHDELERRLLEMGFVEGAQFQIIQEGLVGRDPIALKLDDMRVALRRREARAVLVEKAA
jgi:ferrous iron transport protein A